MATLEMELIVQTAVPKKFLEPIGYLTIYFSILEASIDRCIYRCLGLFDNRGIITTAQFTSFKAKTLYLQALADQLIKKKDDKDNFNAHIKLILKINENRNEVIHGVWGRPMLMTGDGASKAGYQAKQGKLTTYFKMTTPAKVTGTAEAALEMAKAIQEVLDLYVPAT